MCGIAGLISPKHEPIEADVIALLLGRMEHRGPDDHGYLVASQGRVRSGREWQGRARTPDAVLLHQRLSIIDLSNAGWQPMSSADGRYHIVFNGEIYNYVELRRELEALGCRFKSQSDTEVLLTAYARWGTAALTRLTGMFAFAVLDLEARRLFLARDPFGIKPLYYTAWQGGLAFASELNCLLALPGIERRIMPRQLYLYLRHGITDHGSSTLLNDISQLPAAHYLEISLDSPQTGLPVRYWQVSRQEPSSLSFQAAAARLRELFLDSVRLHLRSDVPVGVSLSGGIDSSSILMAVRHLLGAEHELHSVSYVADGSGLGEEQWIDLAGEASKSIVHKVRLRADEMIDELGHLIAVQGEPFASTTIYAQYRVFRLAQEAGVKVLLDGQGADELLGGYRYFISARLASLLRQRRWHAAVLLLTKASRNSDTSVGSLIARSGAFLVPQRFQALARRVAGRDLAPHWLNAGWFRARGIEPAINSFVQGNEVLRAQLHKTLWETSLPHLLRYEDRNSMAHSIESRVPFLTPQMATFLLSLPEEYIIAPDGTSKAVFREAMRGLVPEAILARRDKIGFATPERQWLAELRPWVDHTLRSEAAARIPPLNLRGAEREWQLVLEGRKDFGTHVWRWLNLIEWARQLDVSFE